MATDNRKQEFVWAIGIALITAVLIIILFSQGFFWRSEARAGDALQGGAEPLENIIIIGIDELSITEIGRFPWERTVYATLLDQLHSARIVAFDIGFFESEKGDRDFVAAIERAKGAGVKIVLSEEVIFTSEGTMLLSPVPSIQQTTHQGYSNLLMDPDGVVRKLSFSLADGKIPFSAKIAEMLGPAIIPKKNIIMNYVGPPGSFEHIAFRDVISERVAKNIFENKIVLVGSVAPDLHDNYLTPVSQGVRMSGVEIHANILQMILTRSYITKASVFFQDGLIITFSILGAVLFFLSFLVWRKPQLMLIGIIPIVLYFVITILVFEKGTLLPVTTPILSFIIAMGVPTGRYLVREHTEKRHLKAAFGKYVSPTIIDEMMKNRKLLALGGNKKEITIMFADIRNFTSLSEKMNPEKLVSFLN